MSMIAKLSINKITKYGNGQLVELGCVASNETMASYAGSEEDKLFTTASPWGEMHILQPASHSLGEGPHGFVQGEQFYAMVLADHEPRAEGFPGAYAFIHGRCASVTDFGGTSKRLEFNGDNVPYRGDPDPAKGRGVDRLNWRMSVDNPAASGQIEAGKAYWIALYPVANFDRDAAIRAAHGHAAA